MVCELQHGESWCVSFNTASRDDPMNEYPNAVITRRGHDSFREG